MIDIKAMQVSQTIVTQVRAPKCHPKQLKGRSRKQIRSQGGGLALRGVALLSGHLYFPGLASPQGTQSLPYLPTGSPCVEGGHCPLLISVTHCSELLGFSEVSHRTNCWEPNRGWSSSLCSAAKNFYLSFLHFWLIEKSSVSCSLHLQRGDI